MLGNPQWWWVSLTDPRLAAFLPLGKSCFWLGWHGLQRASVSQDFDLQKHLLLTSDRYLGKTDPGVCSLAAFLLVSGYGRGGRTPSTLFCFWRQGQEQHTTSRQDVSIVFRDLIQLHKPTFLTVPNGMPCYHKMFLNSESSELSIKMQTCSLLSKQLGIEENEMPLKSKVGSSISFGLCD